jgi:hypothetical protein
MIGVELHAMSRRLGLIPPHGNDDNRYIWHGRISRGELIEDLLCSNCSNVIEA